MNLRNKVNVTVVIAFAIAIVALIVTAATSSRKIMGSMVSASQQTIAGDNAASVNSWLLGKQAIISAGAKELSRESGQSREYLTGLIKLLAGAGGFSTVYPGYENGLFVSSDGWVPDASWDHRKRPWYEKAKSEMKVSQTEPYVDAQTGKTIISFIAPITSGGSFTGVLSSDIMLDEVIKQVLNVKVGSTGYAFIMDKTGKILVHPKKELVLKKKFQEVTSGLDDLSARLSAQPTGSFEYRMGDVAKTASYARIPAADWYLCVTADKADVFAPVNRQVEALMAIGAIFLAAGIAVIFFIVRSLLSPLGVLCHRVADLAEGEGDLTKRVDVGHRRDEIGLLAEKLNTFVENMGSIISQIASASRSLASESNALTSTSMSISVGAESVAGQTATVATASEEMAATAADIASNCHRAADSAQHAADTTQEGFKVVSSTVEGIRHRGRMTRQNADRISSLGERSEQIGAIVATIEDIADQTNLLALNAAIEAARAGEQGRGFAVVADEVRALAERTTRATKEIGDMIKAIQLETRDAITSMEEGVRGTEQGAVEAEQLEGALKKILEQVNDVTTQVSQIATAAEEQGATTGEITNNIQQVTAVVQETASGAQDSAQSASRLSELSGELQRIVGKFKL
ncbi:methyl-accepting chemotaxis protein [Geomonas subterranea]|uniref:Methyl-accepting chemotaxis protein n=1 Tax=Geomonas subterranea TaxID=2847989 RepID=A0ABX8LKR1_9BACT|nr:methyl-accepting chemotaxis protein [Geomonas subterranea]QXE91214.1 methyl-accepting chemotaxis protein [Geomonas subterranea]QXM10699.1 methyl-accepting chemotaxis protein [Geomonas subterranea]